MPSQATLLNRLARALPDIPRWVETREMLLDGTAEVIDLRDEPELSFVAVDSVSGFIGIVGRPLQEAIVEAAERSAYRDQAVCEIRARSHVAGALPDWKGEEAPLFLLKDGSSLLEAPRDSVRLLAESDIAFLEGVSPDLHKQLRNALEWSPLAARSLTARRFLSAMRVR